MAVPSPNLLQLWSHLGIDKDWVAERGLPLYAEAQILVEVPSTIANRVIKLSPAAASAWQLMQGAAQAQGIALELSSGWRSIQRQTELIEHRLAQGMPIELVLQRLAPPGCSEHHTGRAIDIATTDTQALTEAFAHTKAFAWLNSHADQFGFTLSFARDNPYGYMYEPWHWCFGEDSTQTTPPTGRQ